MIRPITNCRACASTKLTQFLNLGQQYLSDFRADAKRPPKYPLIAVICDDCKLVQLKHTPPQEEMYHENYGFKSGINDTIRADLDDIVTHAFQYENDPQLWVDIASNDGTLLSFVPIDIYRIGVDPVGFLCKQAEKYADLIINDYFTADVWSDAIAPKADVVTSISCFYDMPDPVQFVMDVEAILAKRGVWIIQQNYLLTTMQLGAVDNFCHEHLEYYTLFSLENLLERFNLEVNEVLVTGVNGGSIRTIVSHKGTYPVDESVERQRTIELDYGVQQITPYEEFAASVGIQIERLRAMVSDINASEGVVAILAASTRGATIWQSAGLTDKDIAFAIERNPAKVGKFFSALGQVPIVSEGKGRKLKPDYMLVGPWFFLNEMLEREKDYLKRGGKFITPLPIAKVLKYSDVPSVAIELDPRVLRA